MREKTETGSITAVTDKKDPKEGAAGSMVEKISLPRAIHLIPMDHIDGFDVRPGFYEVNGATAIPGGVNFTVYSHNAVVSPPGEGTVCGAAVSGPLPDRQCIFHDRV